MRLTSIIVLVIAALLGALAVIGVRAMLINSQRAAKAQIPDLTQVVVAAQPLEFGTEISAEHLKVIQWGTPEPPAGAFTNINEILSGERRVALRSIAPGELVLKDRVSGFGGRATLSQIIDADKRAVTLRINDVSGAGGFVLPGDRVDVLSTIQPKDDELSTYTSVLLEDVRVLGIDQMLDDAQEGAVVGKAATLEVTPEDAQRIALASTIGELSLTLRNIASARANADDGKEKSEKPRVIAYRDLSGAAPAPVTTVKKATVRRAAPKAKAPAPVTTSTMRILRGSDDSTVSVLRDAATTKITRAQDAVTGTSAATGSALKSGSKTVSRSPASN